MTIEEKRRWLWRYQAGLEQRMNWNIRWVQQEERLSDVQEKMKRTRTQGMHDRWERAAARCEREMRALELNIAGHDRVKAEILTAINGLESRSLRRLMTERYLDGKQLCRIAVVWGYSPSAIYQKHRTALEQLKLPMEEAA